MTFLGETMMTETTPIQAADIASVIEAVAKEKTPRFAPVVETKPIVAQEYVDPIDEDYRIMRKNHVGGVENRESAEGIASLHAFFLSAGDMPEL